MMRLRASWWVTAATMLAVAIVTPRVGLVAAGAQPLAQWKYRVALEVDAAGHERRDMPVEVELNFTQRHKKTGRVAPFDPATLRMVEVSRDDQEVLDDAVCFQFDATEDFDAAKHAAGTLAFLLRDITPAASSRRFHILWGGDKTRRTTLKGPVALTNNVPYRVTPLRIPGVGFRCTWPFAPRTSAFSRSEKPRTCQPCSVNMLHGVPYRGQASYKIVTPSATYYYHRRGAGFASIIDPDGNDWISYKQGVGPVSGSGSGGKFRGIPNMGYPEGYCHPGKSVSRSRIVSHGPVCVRILSESDDGKMACRWDVFPHFARMTLLKMRTPYWFLYEGTPGGRLDMATDFCIRPDGHGHQKTSASQKWDGDISATGEPGEWVYFGANGRVLYLVHHEDDGAHDSYWPMNKEMTVFGFGRNGLNKSMQRVPARFTVGLLDRADHADVLRAIHAAYLPLRVKVDAMTQ